jgi:hypothetical protein
MTGVYLLRKNNALTACVFPHACIASCPIHFYILLTKPETCGKQLILVISSKEVQGYLRGKIEKPLL